MSKKNTARERALHPQDVMLISPTWCYAPLSTGLTAPVLAAPLRELGLDVGYQDYSLGYIGSSALESAANSRVVGISVNTTLLPYALALSDVLKEINPRVKIVFGGYHPTDAASECFQSKSVDYAVLGEGDYSFRDLVIALIHDQPLEDIPGIVFKKNGNLVINEPKQFIENLDELPLPAFDIVDWNEYREPDKAGVNLARGCIHRCGFCSPSHFWNHRLRRKGVERIEREYDLLYRLTGRRKTRTQGSYFLPIPGWSDRIAEFFGRNGYRWDIQTVPGSFKEDDFKHLLENGLISVFSGIESGSEKMRRELGKNFNWKNFEQMVQLCNQYGALYKVSFLVGYVGETEQTVKESIECAKRIIDLGVGKVKTFIPAPFPGTSFTRTIVNEGLVCPERIVGYESVDPSTAVHYTGKGGEYLSPDRIEELVLEFNSSIGAYFGFNSRRGQEEAIKKGEEKFIPPLHEWGKYEDLLNNRLVYYRKLKPAYLLKTNG